MANWKEDILVTSCAGLLLWMADRVRDFMATRRKRGEDSAKDNATLKAVALEKRADLEIAKVQDGAAIRDDLIALMKMYYEEAKEARKELTESRQALYEAEQERIKCEQKYNILQWEFSQIKVELDTLRKKLQRVEDKQTNGN